MGSDDIRSVYARGTSSDDILRTLTSELDGVAPKLIVLFAGHRRNGAGLTGALSARYSGATVVGCTTAGEFTESSTGVDGVSALGLGAGVVKRVGAAIARCDKSVDVAVRGALDRISAQLGQPLREADPARYVGLTFIDGLHMHEEEVNEELGNGAPLMSFVGGSAGDDCEFERTRVFLNGEEADEGAVLAVIESAVPFVVEKTCCFESTGRVLVVTKADPANRVVYEFDGGDAVAAYAEAVGVPRDRLDASVFMVSPVGLMIDGAPWIRSPQRVMPDGGLRFYCRIEQGMEVHLMRSTDLVQGTRRSMDEARKKLGGSVRGGLAFNCILRRLEMDAKRLHAGFLSSFEGMKVAGFHTYGESWLGHINQTLTGLWFK